MSPYRDSHPPKRHRWKDCGFNRSCADCNGLWIWGTSEPSPDNGYACNPDEDLNFKPLCVMR